MLVSLVACTQSPARIVYKGENFYGKEAVKKHKKAKKKVIVLKKTRKNQIVVQQGQTLASIATKYKVSQSKIIELNKLENPDAIKVGDILTIPQTTSHKVKKITLTNKVKFIWPVKGSVISKFGVKPNGVKNDGINIASSLGVEVQAAADGKVVYVGNGLTGYGNLIIIKHASGWLTVYGHNDQVNVSKGQFVKQGDVVATVGSSGNVEKAQLHFGIRKGRTAVDPSKYLKK